MSALTSVLPAKQYRSKPEAWATLGYIPTYVSKSDHADRMLKESGHDAAAITMMGDEYEPEEEVEAAGKEEDFQVMYRVFSLSIKSKIVFPLSSTSSESTVIMVSSSSKIVLLRMVVVRVLLYCSTWYFVCTACFPRKCEEKVCVCRPFWSFWWAITSLFR